ncbi:MAG: SGNH/GDSL hydrolase family protein [Oscillospiraceae bacterium]|nr:SGNH/GDSL hydrolase family protein [Oscillospiraceae bacterium]
MRGRLAAIKNIVWAFSIVLCLLAVFVGLLFAAFTRSSEEQFRGALPLGSGPVKEASEEADAVAGTRPAEQGDGTLKTLPETADAGQAYLDSLTFLCDSTTIGLRDYGILSGGTETAQVWATPSGVLSAVDIGESKIVFPNDGSIVSAANAAMVLQPRILVISLGNDGLGGIDQYEFIPLYEMLIRSIWENSPNTYILCLPLTSVTESYDAGDGVSPARCQEASAWIRTVCENTGAYYVDAVSAVQDENGALMQEYASANGKTLNSSGINQILQFLRYHAVTG